MTNARKFTAILLLALTPARAHRADEYLQATVLTIEKGRIEAQIRLTPGTSVFPLVIAGIDTDGDSAISPAEQRAYAEKVLTDLTLTVDGARAKPHLISTTFPSLDELREGAGVIQLVLAADVRALPTHTVALDNRHHRPIAAYLVNCAAPSDPDLQIAAQRRNYEQSHFELEYTQRGVETGARSLGSWLDLRGVLALFALLLLLRLAWARRKQRG